MAAWLEWQTTAFPDNRVEIEALEADRGRCLAYVRMVGRRRPEVKLEDRVESMPAQYTREPLLRDRTARGG